MCIRDRHGTEKAESVLAVLGLVSRLGIFNQDFFLFARIWILILIAQTDTGLDVYKRQAEGVDHVHHDFRQRLLESA